EKASPALRGVILPSLAARRDADAVPAIAAVAAGPDEAVWLAAVEALGAIADPSAAPAMLKAAETGPEAVKLAAAQGYVRVADGMAEKQPSEASAMYHRVLGWQGDEARAAALVGLRRMASPEALPKIEPLLDKEKGKVRDEAINVCIAIGVKQLEAGKRDEAKRIFQKTLGLLPGMDLRAADLKKRLRALGEKMVFEAKDGVISAWWLLGSFKVEQKDWEKALEPEKEKEIDLAKEYTFDGKKRRWDPVQTSDAKGIVQLDPLFTPNDNCGCYAYAEIVVGEEQDVRLKLGSDDGIICWVNGKQVHAFLKPRSLKVDEDDVEAHFAAGVNKVLLKILEGGGQWNFCVRLTDAKGQPLKFRMQ
ncbi:MAG: hypothetical protein FJ278_17710, partial [Planctomycetes bacterium]|nr:hypothetical protein [Planctomycetota bacterium]